jgi:dCTP deaminase
MAFVNLRSSYARIGLTVPPTIIDANFEGQLTIEMIGGEFPVRLYSGERFIHVVFAKLTSPVEKPYSGRYQRQRGIKLPVFK